MANNYLVSTKIKVLISPYNDLIPAVKKRMKEIEETEGPEHAEELEKPVEVDDDMNSKKISAAKWLNLEKRLVSNFPEAKRVLISCEKTWVYLRSAKAFEQSDS